MKRKLAVLSMLLFAIFTLTGMSQAQEFRLKLGGGYGTMTTGDYNSFGAGLDDLISTLEALGATQAFRDNWLLRKTISIFKFLFYQFKCF
jgi:hypothetical protein